MLLINKLAAPGEIRRMELRPDTIRVKTRDGKNRLYRLVSVVIDDSGYNKSVQEVNSGAVRRFPVDTR